jgi:hypothetical protein
MQNSLEIELPVYVICGACGEPVSKDLVMAECPCGHPICCDSPCQCEGVWNHLKWFANARYYALDERYFLVRKIGHFPIWCRKTILTFLRNLNTTTPAIGKQQKAPHPIKDKGQFCFSNSKDHPMRCTR